MALAWSGSTRSSGWSITSRAARGGRPEMRFGYWMPVFGGWLRNVADEAMDASFAYVKRLARRSETIGFDLTLIAELFLNDIKGIAAPSLDAWTTAARPCGSALAGRRKPIGFALTRTAELFLNDIKGTAAPSLDAWTTAAGLAAVTESLELMVAVRPTFHAPAIFAKQAANLARIANGRLSLNVVSSWWSDEARRYGVHFEKHDDRYARTAEWLAIVKGGWTEPVFTHRGVH